MKLKVYKTLDGNIEVNTSGLNAFEEDFPDYLMETRNFGIGIDLGATYHHSEKLEGSISLLDVGSIKWKNDLATHTNHGKSSTITGVDIRDFIGDSNLDTDSLFNGSLDSLEGVFDLEEIEKEYTTWLTPKLYIGAKYHLNEKHHFYGTLMFQFFDTKTRSGLSLGYELDLGKHLGLTANYSIYNNSFANIGLGLRVRGGPIQLYVITDSMLASFDAFAYRSIHVRFGVNILIDEKENKDIY